MGKAKIFIAYARKDIKHCQDLQKQLKYLERQHDAEVFYDGLIEPGAVWNDVLQQQIRDSDIILLLLSPDFVSSDYIMDIEVPLAFERYNQDKTQIIPVLLHDVNLPDWMSKFQIITSSDGTGRAISAVRNRNLEWQKIAYDVGKKAKIIYQLSNAQEASRESGLVTLRIHELKSLLRGRLPDFFSVCLCSRSGIGWNSDLAASISLLSDGDHKASDSKFLFLDPYGEIFNLESSISSLSTDKKGLAGSPNELKRQVVMLYDELCKRGHQVRVADVVLPPAFWVCAVKASISIEAYIEVPVMRTEYGGNLYIKAEAKKGRNVEVYSKIFDDLWKSSKVWKLSSIT